MTSESYHVSEKGITHRVDQNWTDAAIQANYIIGKGLPEKKWSPKQKRDRDTIHGYLTDLLRRGYIISYDEGLIEWGKIPPAKLPQEDTA